MNVVFKYFFYAVGLVTLIWAHEVPPDTVTFADWVRLVQSAHAQQMVVFVGLMLLGCGMMVRSFGRGAAPQAE